MADNRRDATGATAAASLLSDDAKNTLISQVRRAVNGLMPGHRDTLARGVDEYIRFIRIRHDKGDQFSPSGAINTIWHAHLLDTRAYNDFCSRVGGFVHHSPDAALDEEASATRYLNTYLAIVDQCTPDPLWWPMPEKLDRFAERVRDMSQPVHETEPKRKIPKRSREWVLFASTFTGWSFEIATPSDATIRSLFYVVESKQGIPATGISLLIGEKNYKLDDKSSRETRVEDATEDGGRVVIIFHVRGC